MVTFFLNIVFRRIYDTFSETPVYLFLLYSVYSIAQRVAPWQHLVGASLPSRRTGYDAVFLTSTGRLTSYGPTGDFNWQVRTQAVLHGLMSLFKLKIRI